VDHGLTLKLFAATASFNVSAKTAAKWVRRFREAGAAGLSDRSSRPHRSPRTTSSPLTEKVLALRRLRTTAGASPMRSASTAPRSAASCARAGMNRLRSLDPPPPVVRYEHKHPGNLIHFDIKHLARI
jgi:transposase-like protein